MPPSLSPPLGQKAFLGGEGGVNISKPLAAAPLFITQQIWNAYRTENKLVSEITPGTTYGFRFRNRSVAGSCYRRCSRKPLGHGPFKSERSSLPSPIVSFPPVWHKFLGGWVTFSIILDYPHQPELLFCFFAQNR